MQTGWSLSGIMKFMSDFTVIGSFLKNDSDFQIRLDFDTFVITGPSTTTTSSTNLKHIGGTFDSAGGKKVSLRTVCATDIFNVAYATSVPSLCGTLSGDHGET